MRFDEWTNILSSFILYTTQATIAELSRKYWYFQETDEFAAPSSVALCTLILSADKDIVVRNGGQIEYVYLSLYRM